MLCRKCGYNHLTNLEELDCASGKRRKLRGASVKAQARSVNPGASVSEVSEPVGAKNQENGKAAVCDPLAIFVTKRVTKGRPRHYVTNAAKQKAYRERKRS